MAKIARICERLAEGKSLAEAAALEGADLDRLRDQVVSGRSARPGTAARRVYDQLRLAQAQHAEEVVELVKASASAGRAERGDPKSIQALLDRMERNSIDRIQPRVMDALERKRQRLADLQRAKETASGIAYTHLLKEERNLEEELEAAEAKQAIYRPENMTQEEWVRTLEQAARDLADADLEPYALEWLRRVRRACVGDGVVVEVDDVSIRLREEPS